MGWDTLEQAITELKKLRDAADVAEETFIRRCMALEDSELWSYAKEPKDVTFGHFLFRMKVCSSQRYDRRATALRLPSVEALIPKIGIEAAVYVAEAPEDKRQAVADSILASAEKNHAKVPSMTAKRISDGVCGGKVRPTEAQKQMAEMQDLANSLADARRTIAEQDKTIVRLEKENAELRERVSAAAPGLAKTGSKSHVVQGKKEHRSQPNV